MKETPAFILLAHEKPTLIKELVISLISSGHDVYVHYDQNSPYDLENESGTWGIEQYPGGVYFAKRVKVAWGEWSIVQATLNCLRLAREKEYNGATRFVLLSGSCMPTKPIYQLADFLSNTDKDFIEAVDARTSRWVAGGIQNERWEYRHYFNYRFERKKFYWSLKFQKKFLPKRKLPHEHTPHIGSQWWCLRRSTVEKILGLLDKDSGIEKFYRRTCVPDEHFFQTLVANLVPNKELEPYLLTKYNFNSWGVPRVYYEDDYEELLHQDKFFARKISYHALGLRKKLCRLASMSKSEYERIIPREIETRSEQKKYLAKVKHESVIWNSCMPHETHYTEYVKRIPGLIYVCFEHDYDNIKEKINILDIDAVSLSFLRKYENGKSYSLVSRVIGAIVAQLLNRSKGFQGVLLKVSGDQAFILDVLRWNSKACFLYSSVDGVREVISPVDADYVYKCIFSQSQFMSSMTINKEGSWNREGGFRESDVSVVGELHLVSSLDRRKAEKYIRDNLKPDDVYIGPASIYDAADLINAVKQYPDVYVYSYVTPSRLNDILSISSLSYIVEYISSEDNLLDFSGTYLEYKRASREAAARSLFDRNIHWPNVKPKQQLEWI
ncbi:beta-1,6-N-acetylglucosaminyltransferase [Salinicola peritrichatus]|uniref:beta-1,6-N-acetylglucosaminyltransferase n=1 Tax=Salinicola peritrichatus TaxID=1267424 RepID=UPI0013A63FA4|nr:beta-1,6-N-acetylglucosaminyltransferase [Salinicola peritrichatus]